MALQWNIHGAIALVAALVAITMGAFVFSTRPDRLQNRRLAAAVIIGGLSAGFYFGAPLFSGEPSLAGAAIRIGISLMIALPPAYLLFLATIRAPLTRALRSRRATLGIAGYMIAVEAAWLLAPERFLDGLAYLPAIGGWHLDLTAPHAGFRIAVLAPIALVQIYGLLVALSAYRCADTPSARQKAGAFACAFGLRDLLGVLFIGYFGARSLRMEGAQEVAFILGIPVMDLIFYGVLGYGILKTQLFDIDLRVKLAVERGLVAAPFAAMFFVAAEALERSVPVESFWLAVGSAGIIVIALRPIRALAARLADRLLPGVEATPEYLLSRRELVYRNAVQAVVEDGLISSAEQRVLERLGRDLALPQHVTDSIERKDGLLRTRQGLWLAHSPIQPT